MQSLSRTICAINMALLGLLLFLQTISTLDIFRFLGIATLLPRLQNLTLSILGWRKTNVMSPLSFVQWHFYLLSPNLGITWPPLSSLPRPHSPSWLGILWAQLSSLSSPEDQPVLILPITQVFLKVIVLPLGRRIPRISSSSALRGSSSSSHKRIPPSSKRKSVVKESMVVKHTKQMALPNLLIMTSIKPLVPLLLQVWLLLFLLLILFLLSLNQKLEHPSSLIDSLSNALLKLVQSVVYWHVHKIEH